MDKSYRKSAEFAQRARRDGRRHRPRRRRHGCRHPAGEGADRAAQGQNSRHALQDRAYDLHHRPGGRARRPLVEGAHHGGRGDQRPGRAARQAQDRDHHRRRGGRHRRQRQRASPHEARGQDRPVHRHHLERQHAGARSGRRGNEPADDLRGRLHRFSVRQGGPEAEIHFPADQHPIGRRHHRCDRRRPSVAAGPQDRSSAPGLQLRAQCGRALHARARAAAAGHAGRVRKLAEARHHRLRLPHHQDPVVAIRICCSPRSGAATMWPGTSRRSATACSRR